MTRLPPQPSIQRDPRGAAIPEPEAPAGGTFSESRARWGESLPCCVEPFAVVGVEDLDGLGFQIAVEGPDSDAFCGVGDDLVEVLAFAEAVEPFEQDQGF
jgi:hypothetical protein